MLQRMTQRMLLVMTASAIIWGGLSAAAWAAGPYLVEYRLTQWKTVHFDDPGQAEEHLATLKKLGCDAHASAHGGHIDVRYRCPAWRSLAVETDAGAHRWERWLRACGFETAHQH